MNVTGDSEHNIDLTLAAGADNVLVAAVITRAKIVSCGFVCDAACTVYVNAASTGAPTDTIALAAGQPYIAKSQAEAAVLFAGTASITAFYVTCATGGNFKFRCLLDNSTNAP